MTCGLPERRGVGRSLALLLLCLTLPAQAQNEHPATSTSLRVVAYNIKHGRGMDGKVNLERTARVLRKLNADLIALQEVDNECTRSGKVDQAAALGKMLGMHARFGHFMDFQGGQYGLAVLSRHPVAQTIRHQLAEGAEPRCALEVSIRPPGSTELLSFVSIHNDWTNSDFRQAQVQDLLKALSQRKHPVVLAGDFNARPNSPSLTLLRDAGYTRIAKGKDSKTFSSVKPTIEIDFFFTRGFKFAKALRCIVHDEPLASDHRPISMELAIPTPDK